MYGFARKKIAIRAVLTCFGFYLATGNIFRLYKSSQFNDGLLVTEFLLYLLSSLFFVVYVFPVYRSLSFYAILSSIALSAVWGFCINPFYAPALLHAGRLILMIVAGVSIGHALYLRYATNFGQFAKYFLTAYYANAALGILLYLFFRSSAALWTLLARYNIDFHGDPHVGRFVSPYFEPNVFAAICCIPFILSRHQSQSRWSSFFFLTILLLTWSRSGITTLCFLLLMFHVRRIQSVFRLHLKKLLSSLVIVLLLVVLVLVYWDDASFFLHRFTHMKTDGSALGRLDSLRLGWEIFAQSPAFGIGYNFLGPQIEHVSAHSAVDSSFMTTLATFGVIHSCLFVGWLVVWALRMHQRLQMHSAQHIQVVTFFNSFIYYTIVCSIFTCQFNNIIYYQFWLIPVIAIFSYLSCCVREFDLARYA